MAGSHTTGQIPENETIATCWDSDRLDIGRVGIMPKEKYFSTTEAQRIVRENEFSVLSEFVYQGIILRA